MRNRINLILELLIQNPKIEVAKLAEKLGVSQVTIRKDLDTLELKSIIKREHGFALLCSPNDINGRIAYHYDEKKRIAARAAELVKDSDTIMIESGSCCALLADVLASTHRDITIITNSAFIAEYIRGKTNIQAVLLGGIYQHDSRAMVGPMVRQCAENFFVDLFFIGTDGYAPQTGFTNKDQLRAQAVRDMSLQAENVIVLTESEKFFRRGTVPMNLKKNVTMVITDSNIPSTIQDELFRHGTQVLTV